MSDPHQSNDGSPTEQRTRENNDVDELDVLATHLDSLAGVPVIFEAANLYGLSASGVVLGGQLHNTRSDDFNFKMHPQGDYLYKIEAGPGMFIGVGEPHGRWYPARGNRSVLVEPDDPSALFRLVTARNGSKLYFSFESVKMPGHLLNHCDGLMWVFATPANNERVFSQDASWQVAHANETIEEKASRLPTTELPTGTGEDACPICLESWDNVIEVLTPCKHTFCMRCLLHVCKMTPPATQGVCALCRGQITLDSLKRVVPCAGGGRA